MINPFDQLLPHIIIPMEDDLLHTAANGYTCGDPTCFWAEVAEETDTLTIVEGPLTYVVDENQLN